MGMEFKDWVASILSLAGIIVTGWFSFLLWRANQKSAIIAAASLELTESITQSSLAERDVLREEYRKKAVAKAQSFLKGLTLLRDEKNTTLLNEIPINHGFTAVELSLYFDQSQRDMIERAWNSFRDFTERHRITADGRIKTTFYHGEHAAMISGTSTPIKEFEDFISKF
ncbi:hypothetical protein CIG75_19060 [Tumebacillus algifaecis]|uniref:Uncharacterized protein n=1 Tax=Tumebacillus algifaecis TaxID=1214604 RepID=A0A223D632_9BACL|nr:hypothetical protein [Tumebacillus algifaecis]ASS76834.1 hypothetical protein CIG75_19060 [Tumebacillus algifaecis]